MPLCKPMLLMSLVQPIAYDSHAYPYFFIDTNADGEAGEDEANFGNQIRHPGHRDYFRQLITIRFP